MDISIHRVKGLAVSQRVLHNEAGETSQITDVTIVDNRGQITTLLLFSDEPLQVLTAGEYCEEGSIDKIEFAKRCAPYDERPKY